MFRLSSAVVLILVLSGCAAPKPLCLYPMTYQRASVAVGETLRYRAGHLDGLMGDDCWMEPPTAFTWHVSDARHASVMPGYVVGRAPGMVAVRIARRALIVEESLRVTPLRVR